MSAATKCETTAAPCAECLRQEMSQLTQTHQLKPTRPLIPTHQLTPTRPLIPTHQRTPMRPLTQTHQRTPMHQLEDVWTLRFLSFQITILTKCHGSSTKNVDKLREVLLQNPPPLLVASKLGTTPSLAKINMAMAGVIKVFKDIWKLMVIHIVKSLRPTTYILLHSLLNSQRTRRLRRLPQRSQRTPQTQPATSALTFLSRLC